MKKNIFLIFAFLIIIIVPFFTYFIFIKTTILGIKTINTDVTIDYAVGFNLDDDALHFGVVSPTGSARRNITIENDFGQDCEIMIKIQGTMQDWFFLSDNNFILKDKEKKDIEFRIKPPQEVELGNYSSEIILKFLKV